MLHEQTQHRPIHAGRLVSIATDEKHVHNGRIMEKVVPQTKKSLNVLFVSLLL